MVKTRVEFAKKYPGLYQKLLYNSPEYLDRKFPKIDVTLEKKNELIRMALENRPKPTPYSKKIKERKLGLALKSYTEKKGTSFDEQFYLKIKKINPVWFKRERDLIQDKLFKLAKNNKILSRRTSLEEKRLCHNLNKYLKIDKEFKRKLEKINYLWTLNGKIKNTFNNMLKCMPKNVKYKTGQKFKGRKFKYWFIDSVHGEFYSALDSVSQSWKKGNSGHPINMKLARDRNITKQKRLVKNLDTKKVFQSVSDAGRAVGSHVGNMRKFILTGKRYCGYRWAYCDKNGKVIK